MVKQYEIYWVDLNPTQGSEIAKIRPCVIVSPPELNKFLKTVIVVPVTSTIRNYPYRVACSVSGRSGEIAVDQIRTVDKKRLKDRIGVLNSSEAEMLRETLQQMFCE